jgi:hypothetical protein
VQECGVVVMVLRWSFKGKDVLDRAHSKSGLEHVYMQAKPLYLLLYRQRTQLLAQELNRGAFISYENT